MTLSSYYANTYIMEKKSSSLKVIGIIIGVIILIPIAYYGLIFFALSQNRPRDVTNSEISSVTSIALSYVNQKYGYHNFSVSSVDADDSYNGFSYAGRNGFHVVVLADDIGYCTVTTSGKDAKTTVAAYDNCVEKYYEKDEKKVFSSEYALRSSFDVESGAIPDDYGHIPTFNELLKLQAVKHIKISQNRVKKAEENGLQAEYVKDITEQFITYYDITEPFEYDFSYYNSDQDYYYGYAVSVDDTKIDITATRDKSMTTISR